MAFPEDINHFDAFKQIVAKYMPASGRALDLGCGDNTILKSYRAGDREVWGTDFVEHPHLNDKEWFRLLGNGGKIPFPDDYFDLVVCISVLEHVEDPQGFLDEVARVLKPTGYFIGQSISGDHYVTWIRRAFGLLPHSLNQLIVRKLYGRDEADTFPAVYRLNRQSEIDRFAQNAGLESVEFRRYADQGYFSMAAPLELSAIALDGVLSRISSGLGRLYFTAILQKRS
jgi:ubiquinone/menaquinone biosynthesis C-methylase UbiE